MKNKKLFWCTTIIVVVYLALDLFDVLSMIHVPVANLNADLLNVAVVVLLYWITYNTIDKEQKKKEENSKYTGITLLCHTYGSCLSCLEIAGNKDYFKAYAKKKAKDPTKLSENELIKHLQELPFEFDDTITGLTANGYIIPGRFDVYLTLRNEYQEVIHKCVAYFDWDEMQLDPTVMAEKVALQKQIDTMYNTLDKILKGKKA